VERREGERRADPVATVGRIDTRRTEEIRRRRLDHGEPDDLLLARGDEAPDGRARERDHRFVRPPLREVAEHELPHERPLVRSRAPDAHARGGLTLHVGLERGELEQGDEQIAHPSHL
jgi:hypothetical protein